MRSMRQQMLASVLLGIVVLSASLSGCLGGDEDEEYDGPIDFIVYYETTSGTITESIQNNQQVSEEGVDVVFDFSYTKSSAGSISTFWFDAGDGSTPVMVNAEETGEISYTYLTHGIFAAGIGAIDDQENEYSENVTIRIEKQITWSESSTTSPRTMNIDVTPDCECPLPEQIKIDSTVTNGETLAFGSPVTVTWYLNNSAGEAVVESPPEQIADGQNANWKHNEFAIITGVWTLEIGLNQEQENVDVSQTIIIAYAADESTTNPFPTEEQTPENEEDED